MKRFWLAAAALFVLSFFQTSFAGEGAPVVTGSAVYVAAPGDVPRRAGHKDGVLSEAVAPGSTVYFEIDNAARAEDFSGLRALVDWKEGSEYAEAPMIEYKKVYESDGVTLAGYRYLAALPINYSAEEEEHRISGELMIAKRISQKGARFPFSITCRPGGKNSASNYVCSAKSIVLSFPEDSGEISIAFESDARFVVDAQGQGPVNVGFSSLALTDIAERYPDARLSFLEWPHRPIFNREGKLYIYGESGQYLYEVTGQGLNDLSESFDEGEEAFILATRRLGSYVLSDRALGLAQKEVAVPNPLNGAAA